MFVLLALSLPAAMPWFGGIRAREHYEQTVLELRRQGVRVTQSTYRRGWLASEAETDLLLAAGGWPGGGADWRLRAHSLIRHGPLSWRDLLRGRVEAMAAQVTTRLFLVPHTGAPLPFGPLLRTRVDPEGVAHVRLQSRGDAALRGDPVELRTRGAQGDIRIDTTRRRIQADVRIGRLESWERGALRMRITDLALASDIAYGRSGPRLGRLNLALGDASITDAGPAGGLRAGGLDLVIETGMDDDRVWATATYRHREMHAGAGRLGNAELRLRADNLSAPTLARLGRSLDEFPPFGSSPGYPTFAPLAALGANLTKLMEGNPRVAVERLYLATGDGPVDGRLTLGVTGWKGAYLFDPERWFEVLAGEGELAVPEALLRRVVAASVRLRGTPRPETGRLSVDELDELDERANAEARRRIDLLVKHELALRESGRIRTRFRMNAGLLTVNGKTVPLSAL